MMPRGRVTLFDLLNLDDPAQREIGQRLATMMANERAKRRRQDIKAFLNASTSRPPRNTHPARSLGVSDDVQRTRKVKVQEPVA